MRTDQKLAEILEKFSEIVVCCQELIASTTALKSEINKKFEDFKREVREEMSKTGDKNASSNH